MAPLLVEDEEEADEDELEIDELEEDDELELEDRELDDKDEEEEDEDVNEVLVEIIEEAELDDDVVVLVVDATLVPTAK